MAPIALMPLHTTTTAPKPKLGFSIESIVGRDHRKNSDDKGSDGEMTTITPPPAHNHKISSFYRTSEPSGLHSHLGVTRTAEEYAPRRDLLPPTSAVTPPGAVGFHHHPTIVSPYSTDALTAMSMGPCHSPYPLTSYLVGREYSPYPWLLSRQPRLLPYRPQGHQNAGFILHQFRKPKRIRTAFSPSQLLTLEHAFEKNHYVVGAERKQLAQSLSLTETQVKVWFQNRRTKHKRQKQEEEQQGQSTEQQNGSEIAAGGGGNSPCHSKDSDSECEDSEVLEDCDDSRDSNEILGSQEHEFANNS